MTNTASRSLVNSWNIKKQISERLDSVFARPNITRDQEALLWRELGYILICGPMPTWFPDRPYGDVRKNLEDLLNRIMWVWSSADPRFPSTHLDFGKTTDQREARELLRWSAEICKSIAEVENEVFPQGSASETTQNEHAKKLKFPGLDKAAEMQAKHGLARGMPGR